MFPQVGTLGAIRANFQPPSLYPDSSCWSASMKALSNTDQFAAATAEARTFTKNALGLPADHQPGRGSSPFLNELLDAHCRPDVWRCSHLEARPVQVWMLTLPFPGWRCRPCMTNFAARMRAEMRLGRSLGQVEEHTCDRCRRYLPSEKLMPAILRQDMWIVVGSLCTTCTATARRHGAQLTGEPA
jgi:hypothetical protein